MRYYCTTLQVSVAKEAYVALSFYTSTARGYMYNVVPAGFRKLPPSGKEFSLRYDEVSLVSECTLHMRDHVPELGGEAEHAHAKRSLVVDGIDQEATPVPLLLLSSLP